ALILGIIGLILSRGNIRTTASPNRIVGILAAVFLIVVMFQVSSDVHEHSKTSESGPSGFSDAVKVHVSFTLWYYLCIVAFLAAAFFSHKQSTAVAAPALTPDADRLPVHTTVESTGSQAVSSQQQAPPHTNEGNQPSSGAV
ncbi:MAG TPA: hypothetical protein VHK91_04910, partial [Flavisolibacter sp.]|nr:hypothetical protein [Flavisolibacter sp.]